MAMKPGAPAPYGRACLICVQTKCKCITRADGGCERCHRLSKDCQRPASSRRKATKKQATQTLAQVTTPSSSDGLSNASTKIPDSTSDIFCSQDLPILSALEAEEYLNIFRKQKLQFLPFLYLSPCVSAAQLQRERPFLWICIMAVSVRSTTQQIELSRTVRLMLSRLMLLELEINVDLLLGLLVFLAWTNCHVQGKQALSIFTQMAVSLVHDLGLNKPAEDGYAEAFNLYAFGYQEPSKSTVRTMEERRAVLGCFLVSSMAATFLQRLDTLKWTQHMDECLEVLIREKEAPTDDILVQQVRLQLIAEKATQISALKKDARSVDISKTPVAFYIKALQSQAQQAFGNTDIDSPSRFITLLHMHSTSLIINAIGFSKTPIPSDDPNMQRIESLYASFNSAKSWLDVFLAIPTTTYVGFPFSIFAQLMRSLVALFELSTLEDPAWDTSLVRGSTDVMMILDQIIVNMQQAGSLHSMGVRTTKENNFDRAAESFFAIRARWRLKLPEPPANPSFIVAPGTDEEVDQAMWNLPENWWFSDIFTSWDC